MVISALYFWFYLRKFYERKKIILFGEKSHVFRLRDITKTAGFDVAYVVGSKSDTDIESYVNLLYEDFNDIFVWIVSDDHIEYCNRLDELGLREHENYASVTRPPYMNLRERFILDVHLGYTSNTMGMFPGVTIYGNPSAGKKAVKIVTLGGSTSDSTAYPWKSWSEILWEQLSMQYPDKDIIVYSAGVCAYDSASELLKLQRDMIRLLPDIVLSYSGLNDAVVSSDLWTTSYQKMIFSRLSFNEKFVIAGGLSQDGFSVGIETDQTPAQRYLKNIRMMYAVCNEFGIRFYSFVQAMMGQESYELKEDEEEMLRNCMDCVYESTQIFLRDVKEQIKKYQYIYDLSTIFNRAEKLYIDTEHVNEAGNRIIAEEIIKILNQS